MGNFGIETVMDIILKDPFFVGFEKPLEQLRNMHVNSLRESYPPYNLTEIDEDHYKISLALAGFSKDQVEVSVDNGSLIIKGDKEESDSEVVLHKGIATRKFTRTFALGEYMEVNRAEMIDGILNIFLERNIPEEKKPKSIKIK